jgi:hypothetical protein
LRLLICTIQHFIVLLALAPMDEIARHSEALATEVAGLHAHFDGLVRVLKFIKLTDITASK